jgi:uncharacterized protein YbjT (DUF2867 family)
MQVVVIGGTGLIGTKVVARLREHGHEARPASPDTGVDTLTGEGVAEALAGADVLVDVSNSPSFEESAVRHFFETGTGNLLAAAKRAGIKHYVILSVVGTRRLQEAGYFRGKLRQEQLLQESGMPYTIVHSTQFFEFIKSIVDMATAGGVVRLAPVLFQPIASDDVARAVARAAVAEPVNGFIEIAGPDQFRLDHLVSETLAARHDPRQVISDPNARYSGAILEEHTLVPGPDAQLGATHLREWQAQMAARAASPQPVAAAAR